MEAYVLAEEIDQYNPELMAYLGISWRGCPAEKIPHVELKQRSAQVKFAIRTGEITPSQCDSSGGLFLLQRKLRGVNMKGKQNPRSHLVLQLVGLGYGLSAGGHGSGLPGRYGPGVLPVFCLLTVALGAAAVVLAVFALSRLAAGSTGGRPSHFGRIK